MSIGIDCTSAQTIRHSDRNDAPPPHLWRRQLQKYFNIHFGFTLPDNAIGRAAAAAMCGLIGQEPNAVHSIRQWLDLYCRWMPDTERDMLLVQTIRRPVPFDPDRVAQEIGGPTKAEREKFQLWMLGIVGMSRGERYAAAQERHRLREMARRRKAKAVPCGGYRLRVWSPRGDDQHARSR
jgi:hypothetical protein